MAWMAVAPVIRQCSSTLYTTGAPFFMMAMSHSMRPSRCLADTSHMCEEEEDKEEDEDDAMMSAMERTTEVKRDYENSDLMYSW